MIQNIFELKICLRSDTWNSSSGSFTAVASPIATSWLSKVLSMIVKTKKLRSPITNNAEAKRRGAVTELTPSTANFPLIIGESHIAPNTPSRAIAISKPIAKAISLPLNHLASILLTVVPAISAPHPKIMKPNIASLAEPGIAGHQALSHSTVLASAQDIPKYLIAAPITMSEAESRPVKRTPILSRIIPAIIRKPNTLRRYSPAAYVPKTPWSHPSVSFSKEASGERMSTNIYAKNIMDATRTSTVHRAAALSRRVFWIFSTIVVGKF